MTRCAIRSDFVPTWTETDCAAGTGSILFRSAPHYYHKIAPSEHPDPVGALGPGYPLAQEFRARSEPRRSRWPVIAVCVLKSLMLQQKGS